MTTPFCVFESAARRYGERTALHDTTLSLEAGRVVGVAGPTGAGKTTFARLAAGFVAPSSGRVLLGGEPAMQARAREGIGYLPDELPRGWRCTVRLFLEMRGLQQPTLSSDAVIDILGLRDLADTPLHVLSKGQWRLALAAYAALGPSRLLVFDEPDSGLDPSALRRMRALITACRDAGSLVLVLSHQLTELDAVCDQLLFIGGGRVLRSVTAAERDGRSVADLYHETLS